MADSHALTLHVEEAVDGPPVEWAADLVRRQLERASTSLTVEVRAGERGPQGFECRKTAEAGLEIAGTDAVGASYGLIGLADQLELTGDVEAALVALDQTAAAAATPVRGIQRAFSSVDEDLPWFTDEGFWSEYLDWMARARFGRFHLAFGMQYNYHGDTTKATDNYLCFAYPFLLDIPGWDVRAKGVSDQERATNLKMLQFIAAETKRRGMDFQLGLWNHAYDYGRGSRPRFEITGLTPQSHADYCAAAITELLAQVPEIDGFSFRVHYEGGIPDSGHEVFWGRVFDALSAAGRPIQVDMHAKGVDRALLDAVNRPGLHAVLGAKYWAEHQGLPYHQASIRRREQPSAVPPGHELTGVTEFSRRFTRYGYADYLRADRREDLIFRVWPGTQRVLLWGDPALAAGYGRFSTFAGAIGVDVCEPLYFKGRTGSGAPGRRDPYLAPDLKLGLRDWTKYKYTYRIWGRKLYNPEAEPWEWRGYLHEEYGDLAGAVEGALAPLSRILPLVTVAHGLSGSNNGYWPEMYTNLPITAGMDPGHYRADTESPAMWGTVSPFDPTTFYIINDWAADAVAGRLNGRYTPIEVADWIDGFVDDALDHAAVLRAADQANPQVRRTVIDVEVLIRLGRFFAAKFRSAAEYALYQASGDRERLEAALSQNTRARNAWSEISHFTEGVYQDDLMFGQNRSEHGSWADRLPAIEADVAAMTAELAGLTPDGNSSTITVPDRPATPGIRHTPPAGYRRGEECKIRVDADPQVSAVRLNYRHVNQAEQFESVELTATSEGWAAVIPAEYTASSYPLMYFFTVEHGEAGVTVHPGLEPDLANQPYVVVMADQGS